MLSSTVFTLDEEQFFGREDLLVISQATAVQIEEDQEVVVTGLLHPYAKSAFEREYDFDWDLSVQEKKDFSIIYSPGMMSERCKICLYKYLLISWLQL